MEKTNFQSKADKRRSEAQAVIDNFTPEIHDIQVGFDVDAPSLFFRQIERANYSLIVAPEKFPDNVFALETLSEPYQDEIYMLDKRYLSLKKKIIIKKLLKRNIRLPRKTFEQIEMMIQKEKYKLLMKLFARIHLFPMNEGTLFLDHNKYIVVRDAFIKFYTASPDEEEEEIDPEDEDYEEIMADRKQLNADNNRDKPVSDDIPVENKMFARDQKDKEEYNAMRPRRQLNDI